MIKMLNKNTREVLREFESVRAAADFLGVGPDCIYKCLRLEQNTAHGYMWAEGDSDARCRARRGIELRRRLEEIDLGVGVAPITESDIL